MEIHSIEFLFTTLTISFTSLFSHIMNLLHCVRPMWSGELARPKYVSNIFFLAILDATISQARSIQSMFVIQAFEEKPTTQAPWLYRQRELTKWINPSYHSSSLSTINHLKFNFIVILTGFGLDLIIEETRFKQRINIRVGQIWFFHLG